MKLAIMQPYFFPYIGYFQLMDCVDKIILYDYVNYIKKGWINRNRILELNKGDVYIQIPVKDASSYKKIVEIEIDHRSSCQKKLINQLYHNYKRTPYFKEIISSIEQIFTIEFKSLAVLNFETIKIIASLLEITSEIEYGSNAYLNIEKQLLTDNYSIDIKSQRVLSICKSVSATTYINPIRGINLYSKELFREYGVDLFFLKTKEYSYPQNSEKFIPHLSILDVLFNCGIENTKLLIKNFELL
jgi:hypothetical protein